MKEPKKEDYGYINGGLEEQAGWTLEGGEIAYYIALKNYKIKLSEPENELEFVYRKNTELQAKLTQAETFIKGLKDTPNDATIGALRSFIDANYENIIK